MTRKKKWLAGTIVVLAAIQFIQPARNQSGQASFKGFASLYHAPGNVRTILHNACYDCHSNTTRYPWYANIQPGGWWLAKHIRDGKEELNFDTFGDYSSRRKAAKLRAIAGSLRDGSMPPASYKWLHPAARLSSGQRDTLLRWLEHAAE